MVDIAAKVDEVRERVAAACARVGRDPDLVKIIAVTKTRPPKTVDAVIRAGIADVGENKVQEFLEKKPHVTLPCRWHMIGTLQRNKVGKVVGEVDRIHSVDRLELAETLGRLAMKRELAVPVLLEVNTAREASKHGFDIAEVADAAGQVKDTGGLELDGLMTIGPLTEDTTTIRRAFQSLARLREKVEREIGYALPHLSMGMTDDFEIAVEEGATMIRVGRVLFGPRDR